MALVFICIMNIIAFASMGIDKQRARKGQWRISERTLVLLALIGGSAGTLTGIYVFRHKTRHRKFTVGVPAILVLQLAAACYVAAVCSTR